MLFDSLDQPPASPTSAAPSEIADACSPAASASVSVSFLELYNEEWGDLLASPAARASMSPGPAPPSAASNASGRHARQSMQPLPLQTSSSAHGSPVSPSAASPAASPRIQIRQHPNGRVFVSGVTEIPVASQLEALRCLHRGVAMRSTAKTAMNSESSRSHAIFSITLTRRTDRATTTSQFHFVDLAGSERLKRTKSTGDRMAEGISINQGLLTLGRVVAALVNNANASPDQSPAVVPYRESKLTRMLQNSLGGNSKTFILACISALDADANETINTLKYATALRQIRNSFHVNVDAVAGSDAVLEECRARLRELQDENTALRKQLDDANALVGGSTQTRLGELESVVHALEARLAQIQEERAVVESVSAARIKDLEEQLESWQRQFEDLESKMEQDSVYTRSTEDTLATALLRMAAPAMLAARDAAGSASPRSDAVSMLLAAQRASRIEADQSMQHGAAARVVQTVNATLPLALQHNVYATPAPTVSRSSIVPPGTNLSGTAAAADGIDASSLDGADAFQTHGSLFRPLVMLSPLERQELEDEISLNEFLLRYLFFLY
nr:hypothetical protein HK105_003904 [Polyrhizophydium stewartii]